VINDPSASASLLLQSSQLSSLIIAWNGVFERLQKIETV